MANKAAGVPRQSAQVIFMIEPEIAGEVEAWRVKRKVGVKSAQYREIFLAGLDKLREEWTVQHGNLARGAAKRAAAGMVRGTVSAPAAPAESVKPRKRAPRKAAA